jgi:hypothetical protein
MRAHATATHPHVEQFHSAVYGTVFGRRMEAVHRLRAGDALILVPDPPGTDNPAVWVHAAGGDVVGHLPFAVSGWLVPWMLEGGRCRARVQRVEARHRPPHPRVPLTELDEPQRLPHATECADGGVEIVARVRGRQLAPDARMALRDHGIAEAGHEDSFIQHHLAHPDG